MGLRSGFMRWAQRSLFKTWAPTPAPHVSCTACLRGARQATRSGGRNADGELAQNGTKRCQPWSMQDSWSKLRDKLWHSPFMTLPAVALHASIFTFTHVLRVRRATGIQERFNRGPTTVEAEPPPCPDSCFPRVLSIDSRYITASTCRPASHMSSWTSKFKRFGAVRRGHCTCPAGRPRHSSGGGNLQLNSVNEPAKLRGRTFHHMVILL